MKRDKPGLVRIVATLAVLLLVPMSVVDARNDAERQKQIVDRIRTYVMAENPRLTSIRARAIARHVYYESLKRHVDYRLILAVMKVESNFDHKAVSPKGAVGLLQITPGLGKEMAKGMGMEWKGKTQLHEPDENVRIGVSYLSKLIEDFETLTSALTAYNRGPRADPREHGARFASAVLREYSRTIEILPEP